MIIVDLDGCVFETSKPLQRLACEALGLDPEEYVRTPDQYDIFHHFPEEHHDYLKGFKHRGFMECEPDVYGAAEPITAVTDLLPEIDRLYRISAYVTARPPRSAESTQRRIAELGLPAAPVIYTHDKAEVCRRLYVRYAIEDNYDYAKAMADVGVRVFLIDMPYNRSHVYPYIYPVTPENLLHTIWEVHRGVGAARS